MIVRFRLWLSRQFANYLPPVLEERWKWIPTFNMFDSAWGDAFLPGGAIKDNHKILTLIEEPVPYAYSVPLLSSHYCDWLVELAEARNKWSYNKKDAYGAWELDMKKLNDWVDAYHKQVVVMDVLRPLLEGLYQWHPTKVKKIFLIKYEPGEFEEMDSHYDGESIISVSVNLNDPEEYEGGELSFLRTPDVLIQRPKGHALIFSGSPVMSHHAHTVTEGRRYVLVYWIR